MGFIPQVVLFLLGNDGLSLEVFSFGWLGFKKPCIASLQNEAAMQEAADEPWEDELPATVAPGLSLSFRTLTSNWRTMMPT